MLYRPMARMEERECVGLYELCHPGWAERARLWYFANPTIVCIDPDEELLPVVAHASFTIDALANTMHLRDTCVHPAYRGRGIARRLMEERERVGRELGVKIFVGCTWAENVAIIKIHEALGYHACQRVPGYFKHNDPPADGIIYIKAEG